MPGGSTFNGFAKNFLLSFLSNRLPHDTRVRDVIQSTQLTLSNLFGKEIGKREALFMLMTHLLYREACPANFIYTYPVRVAKTCCVMTIGTSKLLPTEIDLALYHYVRSIFTPPLLLDYAAREAEARIEAERNALWEQTALEAAHHIGTPVSNVILLLELLEKYMIMENHADVQATLASLLNEAKLANDIIYDFKRLSYVHNLKPSVFPVQMFFEALSARAEHHGFECISHVDGDLYIKVDELRFSQCLAEILTNACRWCRDKHKKFTMTATLIPGPSAVPPNPGRSHVELHFRDNGPGINSDFKTRIFEQFYSKYPSGTGLGLPYVKRIVEAHDGKMVEMGQEGSGADFAIWLPSAAHDVLSVNANR